MYALKKWLRMALSESKGFFVRSKSVFLLILIGLLLNVIPAKIALAQGHS